jgi:hypothetical protein
MRRVKPWWLKLLLCVFLMVVPRLSSAQTCDVQLSRFPEPSAGVDAVEVLTYGGIGGRILVSVDASGRVALLNWGQCPDQTKVGSIGGPAFDVFLEAAVRAIESVRSQPARPNESLEDLLAIIEKGRMEPLCLSLQDGVDVDVTLYIRGSKERYSCVTGALLEFGRQLLNAVSAAVRDASAASPQ